MHRSLRYVVVASAVLALVVGSAVTSTASAASLKVNEPCTSVEGIFAAGSGQSLLDGESRKFTEQMTRRVTAGGLTYRTYELGTESYGGQRYNPLAVNGWSFGNAIGGKISSGGAFAYGNSVNRGVNELTAYLPERQKNCPETVFVLGGYSQGAQVIGETYTEKLLTTELEPIAYNILLGDPKLYLPEGKGWNPPACRGIEFSAWRAGQIGCKVDNGSLGQRAPYLNDGWDDRTGLWCNDKDFVCGSEKVIWNNSGHGTYADPGGAIDAGVIEAMKRIKKKLGAEVASDVDDAVEVIGTGTTGADVVFTIDSTGSMAGHIEAALAYADTMAASIVALRGRVALVEYRDVGDEFVAEIRSPLSSDLTRFKTALANISADGGGDTPEALLAAIMTGLNGLDWQDGATKSNVILTDASFHSPDVATGVTLPEVAKRALEIDPVNVYPVVPDYLVSSYEELAAATSGQVIENTGDTAAALTAALVRISARPVPLLALAGYAGLTGEEFTFNASKSYVVDSEITEYAFDFDGDGVFDDVGLSPVASYVYPAEFTGVMQVRVTAADGGIATASATVSVTDVAAAPVGPGAPQDLTATIVSTVDGVSEVDLAWTAADSQAVQWMFRANEFHIGTEVGTANTVRVTDVERTEDVTFSVAGVTSDDLVGEASTVVLTADVPEPTPADMGGSSDVAASVATPDGPLAKTGAESVSRNLFAGVLLLTGGLVALLVGLSRRRRACR